MATLTLDEDITALACNGLHNGSHNGSSLVAVGDVSGQVHVFEITTAVWDLSDTWA